jgi:hypothetical protein
MLVNKAGAKAQAIPVSIFNSASLTGVYQLMNASGTTAACYLLSISNGSNVDVIISFDGITDHFYIVAGRSEPLYGILNQVTWPKHQKVYIKQSTAAGVGKIALSGLYSI